MANPIFETLDNILVHTHCCPCDKWHSRDDYRETDRRFVADQAAHRIYSCPNGRLVYMRMTQIDLPPEEEKPGYVELEVEFVPKGAQLD